MQPELEIAAEVPGTDLAALVLADGEDLPADLAGAPGAADTRAKAKSATLVYPQDGPRTLVVGIGKRDDADAESLRVAGAIAAKRARALQAGSLAWRLGDHDGPAEAAALVEGTVLGAYRFDRFRTGDDERWELQRLTIVSADAGGVDDETRLGLAAAVAANRTRELQNLPANLLNPQALAERAQEIAAANDSVEVEILDRDAMAAAGMGGLVAVSAGTAAEPRLIALRYSGGGGERIGLVGKAVTFDSGGISIKPSAGMQDMKMDMSGGAAVLEAFAAIAELGIEIDLVAAIPATENMPSGTATRPGDIITQLNGKTVEVNNTDAEGRLILADALTYCVRELGAKRVIDLATLTGAVIISLGSTYAALLSNDDGWAKSVGDAATATGELAWRLPLHPEYKELTRGTVADLTNAAAKRKAGTIYAASFLEEFVDDVPWVHLDIAGTAWDTGREYAGNGATGFGTRLLIRLARDLAGGAAT